VSEELLKAHIYTHVTPEFRGITTILQHQGEVTIEEVMDALREDEEMRRSYDSYCTSASASNNGSKVQSEDSG
jgi:hypothetical protein